jgi:hypothetical protein
MNEGRTLRHPTRNDAWRLLQLPVSRMTSDDGGFQFRLAGWAQKYDRQNE